MKNFLVIMVILLFTYSCKFQTRALSRFTGSALKLELPKDFDKPISFASGRKSEKDLFYYSSFHLKEKVSYKNFFYLLKLNLLLL